MSNRKKYTTGVKLMTPLMTQISEMFTNIGFEHTLSHKVSNRHNTTFIIESSINGNIDKYYNMLQIIFKDIVKVEINTFNNMWTGIEDFNTLEIKFSKKDVIKNRVFFKKDLSYFFNSVKTTNKFNL